MVSGQIGRAVEWSSGGPLSCSAMLCHARRKETVEPTARMKRRGRGKSRRDVVGHVARTCHCFTRLHWVAAERASLASDSAPYPVPTPPSSSDEDVLMCPFAGSPHVRGKEERRRSTVVSEILGMCVGLMSIGLMSICCALCMAVRSGYGDGRLAGWGVRGKGIMIHHRW